MDEQFSPEYIAFMRGAGALQALWVPKAGDWAWADEDIKAVLLVNIWPPQRKGGLATIEAAVYGEELGPCSYEFIEGEITWLPSLFQLIRVIEGAGYTWERLTEEWNLYRNRRLVFSLDTTCPTIGDMLAAARLAVRAVEAQDETTTG